MNISEDRILSGLGDWSASYSPAAADGDDLDDPETKHELAVFLIGPFVVAVDSAGALRGLKGVTTENALGTESIDSSGDENA